MSASVLDEEKRKGGEGNAGLAGCSGEMGRERLEEPELETCPPTRREGALKVSPHR